MITTFVRRQIVAFVAVALLGMAFVGVKYVGLDRYFGGGGYRVSMELASSGGIFSNAEVTYRGVPVGRVGELTLTPNGVAVELVMADGGAPIPTSLTAVVANRSAVGEQYVDLRPDTDRGPFLQQGSIITPDHTVLPVPTELLLTNLDGFVHSVPLDSLQTAVSELGHAFAGKGRDLQTLIDQGNLLTRSATENLPQTLALIREGRTALDTQNAQGSAIQDYSKNLKLIAAQLQTSDPDLRRLITTGQGTGTQISALLGTSGQDLSQLVANLLTVNGIAAPRQTQIRSLFQVLPAIVTGGYTAVPGDGTTHFGSILMLNDPPVCAAGYEGTTKQLAAMQAKNPGYDDTVSRVPLNVQAYCAEPKGSPISVRGAQNAQRPSGTANIAVAVPGGTTAQSGQGTGLGGSNASASAGSLLQLLGLLLPA